MTPHVDQRLSAYIDHELAAAEREEVASHLATCPDCSRALEELQGVVAMAQTLEDRPPEAELWPEIEARLGAAPAGAGSPARVRWTAVAGRSGLGRRQFTFSLPQLAAAGLALVLLSGGAVWVALRQSPMRAGAAGPIAAAPGEATIQRSRAVGARQGSVPSQAAAEPSVPPARGGAPGLEPDATDASVASFDESKYQAAVAELERVLRDHRDKLDPATVQILEHNLAIIDRAIAEARSALLADPANPYLNGHLAQQLKRKIWLLQRVTDVVAAHG